MLGDMMDKLQNMKQQVEEIKAEMADRKIDGEAEGVRVIVDGNRQVKDIHIPAALSNDMEAVEDLLVIALNKALEKAEAQYEQEMAKNASGLMGNLPGF